MSDVITKNIHLLEQANIQESLEKCNKTAVIMPDHIARWIYKKLVKEMQIPYAFFGEELFSDVDWMFVISGIILSNLIQQIHKMAESGIWLWWMELFEEKNLINKNVDSVQAANMRGNIVVIFVVWALGITFACLCVVHEKFWALLFSISKCTYLSIYHDCKSRA